MTREEALAELNFNPRSPCGERQGKLCGMEGVDHFNPRSPCGERHPQG